MNFAWNNGIGSFVITLVILVLLYSLLLYVFLNVVKRKAGFVILGVGFAFNLLSYLFCLIEIFILTSCLVAVGLFVCFFANLGDLRAFIANPFKRTVVKPQKFGVEKIFDREEMYHQIEKAVSLLSEAKIGAIITFERNTPLKDIMKNGVPVNAPVSCELLQTIFYPGTRLHDGAVVIHGNNIVAASVFFTPSTKPFAVKYGSRHRAAIGISEVTDAITVVVSEETGRISIAMNGQLETIAPNNFNRVFENYMSQDDDDDE